MAVLDKVDMSGANGVTAIQMIAIRSLIAHEFWAWYEEHKEDQIIKAKVLILSVTVRVKSAKFIFVALLGPQPGE